MIDPSATDCDGLLLIGHGTRDAAGLAEFWQLVELVRHQRPGMPVEGCFLELAEPQIAAGLAKLARRGARHVRAVPLVLFAAGHAKRDIPQALAAAAREHPHVSVAQTEHLGCQPAIVELSEWRFQQSLRDHSVAPADGRLLLLVGRGSTDPEATREMQQFAAARSARDPSIPLRVAFIAMAEPRLDLALEEVARGPQTCCIVQPHLLFAGLLLAELQLSIERIARQVPGKRWIVADPLGPDIRLARAIGAVAGQKMAAPAR